MLETIIFLTLIALSFIFGLVVTYVWSRQVYNVIRYRVFAFNEDTVICVSMLLTGILLLTIGGCLIWLLI